MLWYFPEINYLDEIGGARERIFCGWLSESQYISFKRFEICNLPKFAHFKKKKMACLSFNSFIEIKVVFNVLHMC